MASSSTLGTRWLQRIDGLSPARAALIGGPLGLLIGLGLPMLPSMALTMVVFAMLLVALGWLGSTGQSVLVDLNSTVEALERFPDPPQPIMPREMWVDIEEGSFLMGSPDDEEGRRENEGPIQRVTVSAFQIMNVTVTAELYYWIMGGDSPDSNGAKLPKMRVSWFDAVRFCNALSKADGLTPCYEFVAEDDVRWNHELDGYRLPTEAEWERACRADTQTAYSFDDSAKRLTDYAWFGAGSVRPIAQKASNGFGLFDMHGNVWEWCWDWLGPYSEGKKVDPAGPAKGYVKTLRGGSRWVGPRNLRSAERNASRPGDRCEFLSFRCARGPRHDPVQQGTAYPAGFRGGPEQSLEDMHHRWAELSLR
ncbi:MAG: SUMF1/EgtB/PvdO family nonheme iron enzyme [Acidobacteriota bacterium]